MNHELKILPNFFEPVVRGDKTFEVRRYDRDFHVGDTLSLAEWDQATEKYTGRVCHRAVSFILYGIAGIEDGYCVMSLKKIDKL